MKCIGTTHLTEMQIDTGDSESMSQRLYLITMKHYDWVRSEIKKLLDAEVIHSSKFVWPVSRVEDIFSKPNGDKYFSTFDLHAGFHHIPLNEDYSLNSFYISFWKIQMSEGSIWTGTSTSLLPRTDE